MARDIAREIARKIARKIAREIPEEIGREIPREVQGVQKRRIQSLKVKHCRTQKNMILRLSSVGHLFVYSIFHISYIITINPFTRLSTIYALFDI